MKWKKKKCQNNETMCWLRLLKASVQNEECLEELSIKKRSQSFILKILLEKHRGHPQEWDVTWSLQYLSSFSCIAMMGRNNCYEIIIKKQIIIMNIFRRDRSMSLNWTYICSDTIVCVQHQKMFLSNSFITK